MHRPGPARIRVRRARERSEHGRRGLSGDVDRYEAVRRSVPHGRVRRATLQEAELPGVRGVLPEERSIDVVVVVDDETDLPQDRHPGMKKGVFERVWNEEGASC